MKRTDIAAGLILAAAATWAVLVLVPGQTSPPQSETTMAPAMMPTLSAGIVLALSLLLAATRLASGFVARDEPHEEFGSETRGFGKRDVLELAIWLAIALATGLIMHYAGFIAAAAIILGMAMLWMGVRNPLLLVAVGLGTPYLITLVARHLFGVEMP